MINVPTPQEVKVPPRRTQRNEALVNMLAQLVYDPHPQTANNICRLLGVRRQNLQMHDKPQIVKAILHGLLDKGPFLPNLHPEDDQ